MPRQLFGTSAVRQIKTFSRVTFLRPLLIDFKNLTVLRGDKSVLRNLTLQIRQGEHVAILGANGSGKSTLIKAITRELYPLDRGGKMRFQLLGRDDWDLNDLRSHLGIVTLDLLQSLSHEVVLRQVTAPELILSGHFNSVGLWPHHRVSSAQENHARKSCASWKFPIWRNAPFPPCHRASSAGS